MTEYNKKIVKDFEKFNQVVGGAMELADRGWKSEVWCNQKYKETIEELYLEYLPEEYEVFIPIKTDDYLEIEDKIANYLETEILELMR